MLGLRLILEVKDGKMSVKDKVREAKSFKKLISDFESVDVDFDSPIVLLELLNEDVYEGLKIYFKKKYKLYRC